MQEDMNFLYRPVLRGMYPATELDLCNLTLVTIAECNEALDVEDENNRRAQEALEKR
jgi:hypothetical protein